MNRCPRRSPFRSSPRRALVLCAAALLQSVAVPVLAQTAQEQGTAAALTAALNGSGTAQSLLASGLDKSWRSFDAGSGPSGSYSPYGYLPVSSQQYYTRGQTLSAGRETYLVAYRQMPEGSEARSRGVIEMGIDGVPANPGVKAPRLRPGCAPAAPRLRPGCAPARCSSCPC